MENNTTKQNSVRQAKEFDSFCKKVRVNNRIWFDALSKTKRYDLFYEWRTEKYNSVEKKKIVRIKMWRMDIAVYPARLKHFIKGILSDTNNSVI